MESVEEQKKSSRGILVAIDGTQESLNALQWVLNNLFRSQDRIILIHAQRNPNSLLASGSPGFMVPVDVLKIFENDIKKSTEKILARATEICKAKNLTPETEVHTGDAREVICNAAKKYNPDMLVLGSHGYGALKRVVLGSVSDYCVHHVQCPVVVVKPQESKAH
jgi:nucleotide-binding universal stress UspA family protein